MAASDPSIVVLGCFDTKGEVFAWLRECLLGQGERVLTINTGVLGTTDCFPVDIEAEAVAEAAAVTLTDLQTRRDRGQAVDCMGRGAAQVLSRLVEEGKVKAVIGMGGGGGTYIALAAMQAVPLGIPKLCLSTVAAKDLSRQVGDKDITLMPSVVDVAGLNSIIRPLIAQAAAAIRAMAGVARTTKGTTTTAGSIAISMFGNTTACVDACTELLTRQGYEVLAFHATGVGGKTMEALIREGCFDAVLDITTTELADDLCGGICSAGPDRLTAAARMGIPQVVVPGCLDMVNFAHPDTVPEPYRHRELYRWAPDVTLMRTNAEENRQLGEQLAQKLNRSAAPVAVLLPLKGISQIDAEGGVFYHPEWNRVLFDVIQAHAAERIEVREVDAHINDRAFAEVLVQILLDLMQKNKLTKTGT
ncbi:Tm-1-like ATP-binding domain-containing protein [Telluribacter sp. SYSU D00476]|uniref:Tm-1-like ATP-binding domain-containing protein n=1 Tax=Telluribacter sp. SYSU D00476 TaxID=2811430 RepID=UPI001FF3033E|nr:Tm-1-like ATP-binding domain-containing protein [Telluribacter sp. SYSU D00476]